MLLKSAQVYNYKCITDSETVTFEDITCLVGKNESGKTAFLQALCKLSPLEGEGKFDPVEEFPRARYIRDYKRKQSSENFDNKVIEVTFELTENDIEEIEEKHGKDIFKSNTINISKNYEDSTCYLGLPINEDKAIKNFLEENNDTEKEIKEELIKIKNLKELKAKIGGLLKIEEAGSEKLSKLQQLEKSLNEKYPDTITKVIIKDLNIPKFFYFDEYSIMKGTVYINRLKLDEKTLEEGEKTFKKFLEFAGVGLQEIENKENYEASKALIEAASNDITSQIFEYWTQNTNLSVELDRTERYTSDEPIKNPPNNNSDVIRVRIKNNKHGVTVPFDNRSKGFVWFFSFLIYFSQIQESQDNIILLLDEPGLSLHAKAQHDFLRFINEKLSNNHQVVYTTHSPFMIPTNAWHTVRIVEDIDSKGTKISTDALKNSRDTVFPLQGALGYDLAQTLFIGENCLIVEGPSDLIYLQLINELLEEHELQTLDSRWVIIKCAS